MTAIERKFRDFDNSKDWILEFAEIYYRNCDGDKVIADLADPNCPDYHGPTYTILPKDGGHPYTIWPEVPPVARPFRRSPK